MNNVPKWRSQKKAKYNRLVLAVNLDSKFYFRVYIVLTVSVNLWYN